MTMQKITNLNDMIKAFSLPKTIHTSIASTKQQLNEEDIAACNPRGWNGMLNLGQLCLNQILSIICPGPALNTF